MNLECPKCNLSIKNALNYCPKCGYKIARICKQCKNGFDEGDMYCSNCGENVGFDEMFRQAFEEARRNSPPGTVYG